MIIDIPAPIPASEELIARLRAADIARRTADLRAQGENPDGWERVCSRVAVRYKPTGYLFGVWLGMTPDELREFSRW